MPDPNNKSAIRATGGDTGTEILQGAGEPGSTDIVWFQIRNPEPNRDLDSPAPRLPVKKACASVGRAQAGELQAGVPQVARERFVVGALGGRHAPLAFEVGGGDVRVFGRG